MSAVQSNASLGAVGLASEYKSTGDTVNTNVAIEVQKKQTVINEQKSQVIQQAIEEVDKKEPLTTEQLDKVAQQLQDFVGDLNRNIEFSVDEDSGRDVIKVIDKESGDVLKQYPSEEVLTLVSKLSDMVGGFVDAKV